MSQLACTNPGCGQQFMSNSILEVHMKQYCPKRAGQPGAEAPTSQSLHDIPVVPSSVTPATGLDDIKVRVGTAVADTDSNVDAETNAMFLYPEPIKGMQVDTRIRAKIERVMTLAERGQPQNMLFLGESGTGKTTLAYHIAAKYKRPLAKINCQMITEASQLFGFREANPTEGTRYVLGQFPVACMNPGTVVLLDDVAHVHDRTITNGLLPALDFTRAIWIDYLGQWIKVADGVVIIGTGNQGRAYGGATKLDKAVVSRFENRIYFPEPEEVTMVRVLTDRTGINFPDATRLAHFARQVKEKFRGEVSIDMRGLLAAASDMTLGASYFEAIVFTLLGDLEQHQRDQLKFQIHDGMTEAELEIAGQSVRVEEWL